MPANELDVRRQRKPDKHPKLTDTPRPVHHGHREPALVRLENSVRQEI